MTKFITKTLTLWCICFFVISCAEQETSSVTPCDNETIADMVAQYEQVIDKAVQNNDCETILASDSVLNDFVTNNYNCLVIYFVLTDDTIETEEDAENHIEGIKEYMSELVYTCEVEESPMLIEIR